MLPTDAQERKNIPIYTGFMVYFTLAIIEVTKVSVRGNEQHNPGSDLHWDRGKSKDERDSQARHLLDQAVPDLSLDDEIKHAAAGAWRAMANLQKLCERRAETPDRNCVTQEDGSCVAPGPCMHTPKPENSESKKIAPKKLMVQAGQWWRGIDETVDEFRERCAPGSSEPSTRQAPRPLL